MNENVVQRHSHLNEYQYEWKSRLDNESHGRRNYYYIYK